MLVRFLTWSHLWLDEALTVNIARLPVSQIPAALRHDGAPPVYYLILHGWMAIFGDSTLAVRLLPGLFGVVSLPLTFAAAKRIAGRRVAWAATLLLASGPFAARYATENRMYSLVMVEVLVGLLLALRLLDGGGRGAQVGLAVVVGLALLTHYWCFYLFAVALLAFAVIARRSSHATHRVAARRGIVAVAGGLVLFLPWLPSFRYQLKYTGTPWGNPANVRAVFDTVTHFAGGYWDPGIGLGLIYFGLIALALFGTAVDGRRILIDLKPRSPGGWLAALTFGTLVLAIVAGRLGSSAFAVRYAAVLYPLFILVVAVGTDVFASPRVFRGVLAVTVAVGFYANTPNIFGDRTNAGKVASVINANAHPGDVVAYCPDQLGPSVSREIRAAGLVQLTFPRAIGPERVDWVNYEKVNKAGKTPDFARMLVDRAGPTHDVWLVWARGYQTFGTKCSNLIDQLDQYRPNMERSVKISTKYFERPGLVRFRAS